MSNELPQYLEEKISPYARREIVTWIYDNNFVKVYADSQLAESKELHKVIETLELLTRTLEVYILGNMKNIDDAMRVVRKALEDVETAIRNKSTIFDEKTRDRVKGILMDLSFLRYSAGSNLKKASIEYIIRLLNAIDTFTCVIDHYNATNDPTSIITCGN